MRLWNHGLCGREMGQALDHLTNSPGWTLFSRWLEDQLAIHQSVVLSPNQPLDNIRVAQGAYAAIKLVRDAPSDMKKTLNATRDSHYGRTEL